MRSPTKMFVALVFIAFVSAAVMGIIVTSRHSHGAIVGGASPSLVLPTDPGPRGGAAAAGGTYSGLTTGETTNFNAAALHFARQWSVTGTVANMPLAGLGPRYNANACSWCHSYPANGGSSPSPNAEFQTMPTLAGASANTVPSFTYAPDGLAFIRSAGPTRIPYQISTGGTLFLYTVVGQSDLTGALAGCNSSVLSQPNLSALNAAGDITTHVPIPLFGLGLVESTPHANLRAAQNQSKFASFGITYGRYNIDGPGRIAHIGQKGAAPSNRYFADLAFAVEVGASNETFGQKQTEIAACMNVAQPEDGPKLTSTGDCSGCSMDWQSEAEADAYFVRYLTPPTPACTPVSGGSGTCYGTVTTGSVYNGQQQFIAVGCDTCHATAITNGLSHITGQNNVTYHPYSDYAIHTMGVELSDGLTQGSAGPQDFKTSALWGVGQRLFFLHDGRTSDIVQAILQHCSSNSEANAVCSAFGALSLSNQQDLINFLRSL